ncbi:MAG: cytochrome b/b6 domain-containing protein [Pseudomonadota bacterium]|nr:cytochrome b/b6 domain-containing protein [Pseudomonadota bacterium]
MNTLLSPAVAAPAPRRFYRHRLAVRLMHWINVVCLTVLLMSGLQIFNAHPALYWGRDSDFAHPWLALGATRTAGGGISGVTTVAGHRFSTDGWLGASTAGDDKTARGFPAWATIPGPQWLSMGRHWHFFFAWLFVINGLVYVGYSALSGHLTRDLVPSRAELRRIGGSIRDHLLLRHARGEDAKRYNVLQNLAYLAVIFVLLPLVILAGMAMSPRLDAVYPGWIDLLGGRQSARSIHFLAAAGLLLFVLVHVFEVLINGAWNQIRSMVTGWYTLPRDEEGAKS